MPSVPSRITGNLSQSIAVPVSFPGGALHTRDLPRLEAAAGRYDRVEAPRSRILPTLWQYARNRDIACQPPDREIGVASTEPGLALSAHVYLPSGEAPPTGWPVAMAVYGGAFLFGRKDCHHVFNVVNALCARGIAVMAVDYRKIPQTHFPRALGTLKKWQEGNLKHAVDDVMRAVDWYAANAGASGLDPDRLALVGFSAGAMLATLAAAHREDRVGGLVGFYGPYVPEIFSGVTGKAMRFGIYGTRMSDEERALYRPLAMPYRGPAFFVHGEDDEIVHVEHSYKLAADRVRRGLETYLHIEPGVMHGFMNDHPADSSLVSGSLAATGDFLEMVFARERA